MNYYAPAPVRDFFNPAANASGAGGLLLDGAAGSNPVTVTRAARTATAIGNDAGSVCLTIPTCPHTNRAQSYFLAAPGSNAGQPRLHRGRHLSTGYKGVEMKQLTLKCKVCGRIKIFRGANVEAVIAEIDAAEWHDMPDGKQGITAVCPDCDDYDGGAS